MTTDQGQLTTTRTPQTPSQPQEIELEALKIEGTIFEPQVLTILERPSIELITIGDEAGHNFLKDIEKPIFQLIE